FTVASTRCTSERTAVVVCTRLSTTTSIFGRNSTTSSRICPTFGRKSVSIELAESIVGSAFPFTSSITTSNLAVVLRTAKYKATRIPACRRTAAAVTAMNTGTRFSIIRNAPAESFEITAELHALGGSSLGGGFLVSLASRFVSRTELILLLIHHVQTLIHPARSLFTSFTGSIANVFTSLLRPGALFLARLAASARRIKNSNQTAKTHSRQKPQKAAAIAFRHWNFLLNKC